MKPCKSCPFAPESLPGLWSPGHYIAIAYLGSANHPALIKSSMGCHQWNGIVAEKRRPEDSPVCGGWMRAARETALSIRMKAMYGQLSGDEIFDDTPVLSPREMLERQGVYVDKLPPLTWTGATAKHPTYEAWSLDLLATRQRLLNDPDAAHEYIVPGGPLHVGVTYDEVADFMGADVADRYWRDDDANTNEEE